MALPQLFEPTIFSGLSTLFASHYIRAMHPKSAIPPTRTAVKKVLDAGWWGQTKIDGHRAQLHIPCDPQEDILVYTRQGQLHKKLLPAPLIKELQRLFTPQDGWNVIDAEWYKGTDQLYVFDMLKFNGKLLDTYPFAERYALLPRVYSSPCIETLPLIKSLEQCMEILETRDERVEGLVFKSPHTEGFADTGVVRCLIKR